MTLKFLLAVLFIGLMASCKKDEAPVSSGTITVDGKQFTKLYVSAITPPAYPTTTNTGQTLYEMETGAEGDGGYFLEINVLCASRALVPGVYVFGDRAAGLKAGNITYCKVSFGDTNNQMTSSNSTQGTFTVAINGSRYTFDFSATIDGHVVTVHYEGLSHTFS